MLDTAGMSICHRPSEAVLRPSGKLDEDRAHWHVLLIERNVIINDHGDPHAVLVQPQREQKQLRD